MARKPYPGAVDCRAAGSPDPTQMTFGSDGAMATAPHDAACSSSKIGVIVMPLFVVRHTPPCAVQA